MPQSARNTIKQSFLFILYIALIATAVLAPEVLMAQEGGLVACEGRECQFCHLVATGQNALNWLVLILTIVAGLLFAYAGLTLVTSAGNSAAKEKARTIFNNVIIGYLIVLASWLIIDTLMKVLLDESKLGRPWSQIECVSQPSAGQAAWGLRRGQLQFILPDGSPSITFSGSDPDFPPFDLDPNFIYIPPESEPDDDFIPDDSDDDFVPDQEPDDDFVPDQEPDDEAESAEPGETGPLSGSLEPIRNADGSIDESALASLREAGVNVASWRGIDGPNRTDLAHPDAVAAMAWMQEEGRRRFGTQPFQVTAAYTRGVGHSPNSQHYNGLAIDFQPVPGNGVSLSQLNQLANDAGFTFVLSEGTHVHADAR